MYTKNEIKQIFVDDDALDEALQDAFKKLYGENGWFKSEEDAEAWAGDRAYDFALNVLESLGIVIEYS